MGYSTVCRYINVFIEIQNLNGYSMHCKVSVFKCNFNVILEIDLPGCLVYLVNFIELKKFVDFAGFESFKTNEFNYINHK